MPTYLSPGVYVEEVASGSKPIEGVGTAVAAFVGMAPRGPANQPTLITNWRQYVEKFGDITSGAYLGHAVYGYLLNGGGNCYVVRIGADNGDADNVEQSPARARIGGMEVRALEPGPEGNDTTIEVTAPPEGSPEGTVRVVVTKGDQREEHEAVPLSGRGNIVNTLNRSRLVRVELDQGLSQLDDLPFGITSLSGGELVHVDVSQARLSPDEYIGDSADRTGFGGLETIPDVTMVCRARRDGRLPEGRHRPRGVEGDPARDDRPLRADGQPHRDPRRPAEHERPAGHGVADGPGGLRLEVRRRCTGRGSRSSIRRPVRTSFVPPSAHVAGIWGRNDDTRGVHKAPANEVVRGAVDLEINISKGEHDLLNPVGVNCLRAFPGRGIRVWGARTLSSDPEWRYLNVRRLFNYLEESILNGVQWAVFEPNDQVLWAKVRRSIAAFLTMEWRKGALFGTTPNEAFFVKCDSETNPAEAIDLGSAHLRGRRGPGEAGGVRDLPSVPVLRRRQPRRRMSPVPSVHPTTRS